MARLKSATTRANESWSKDGDPIEMADGREYQRWVSDTTGESRVVPVGSDPESQPLAGVPLAVGMDDDAEETAAERVASMLRNAAGTGADVKLYRDDNGSLEYCAQFSPEEFESGSFELVRQRFGPGSYELRMYGNSGTAHGQKRFGLIARTKLKIAKETAAPMGVAGVPAGFAQVLETLANSQRQMMETLAAMKQEPRRDPAEEMSKMFGLMAAMREAMGISNVAPPAPAPQSSIGEIIKAVRELREVSNEINPPPTEPVEPGLMDMLPKVLDLVKVGQAAQAAPGGLSGAPFPPLTLPESIASAPIVGAPVGGVAAPVSVEPAASSAAPEPSSAAGLDAQTVTMLRLRVYLDTLVKMAQDKTDPKAAADYVIENLPDELLELLDLPNWLDLLCGYAPVLDPHREWLQAVHAAMIDDDEAPA